MKDLTPRMRQNLTGARFNKAHGSVTDQTDRPAPFRPTLHVEPVRKADGSIDRVRTLMREAEHRTRERLQMIHERGMQPRLPEVAPVTRSDGTIDEPATLIKQKRAAAAAIQQAKLKALREASALA